MYCIFVTRSNFEAMIIAACQNAGITSAVAYVAAEITVYLLFLHNQTNLRSPLTLGPAYTKHPKLTTYAGIHACKSHRLIHREA